eukprot:336485-Amphidinium_carterae.2
MARGGRTRGALQSPASSQRPQDHNAPKDQCIVRSTMGVQAKKYETQPSREHDSSYIAFNGLAGIFRQNAWNCSHIAC